METLVILKSPRPVSNRICNSVRNQNKIIFCLILYYLFLMKSSNVRLDAERDKNTRFYKGSPSRI